MFFAISFFHSLMNQRDRFGAIGWKAPYSFSNIESHLGTLFNFSQTKLARGNAPNKNQLLTFNYFLSQIIYGSRIFDEQDLVIARSIADTVINSEMISS